MTSPFDSIKNAQWWQVVIGVCAILTVILTGLLLIQALSSKPAGSTTGSSSATLSATPVEPPTNSAKAPSGLPAPVYLDSLPNPQQTDMLYSALGTGVAVLNGKRYPDSVFLTSVETGTTPTLAYTIPEGAREFSVIPGLDQTQQRIGFDSEIAAVFKISVDGTLVQKIPITGADRVTEEVIPVSGHSTLALEVDVTAGPDIYYANVDWAQALFR